MSNQNIIYDENKLIDPPFTQENRDELFEKLINEYKELKNMEPNSLIKAFWDTGKQLKKQKDKNGIKLPLKERYLLPLPQYQTIKWYKEQFKEFGEEFIEEYKQKHGFLPGENLKKCRGHSGGSCRKSKLQTKFIKKISRKSKRKSKRKTKKKIKKKNPKRKKENI